MSKENDDDNCIRAGSTNVFADLGYANADTHLLKAQLVSRIQAIMGEKKLNQTQAAQVLGISQPDVSRLLKGQFREFSVERIMRMLTHLGCDVDIVIKAPGPKCIPSVIRLGSIQSREAAYSVKEEAAGS